MQKYEIFSLLTHIHRFFYAHNYGFFILYDVCIKKVAVLTDLRLSNQI